MRQACLGGQGPCEDSKLRSIPIDKSWFGPLRKPKKRGVAPKFSPEHRSERPKTKIYRSLSIGIDRYRSELTFRPTAAQPRAQRQSQPPAQPARRGPVQGRSAAHGGGRTWACMRGRARARSGARAGARAWGPPAQPSPAPSRLHLFCSDSSIWLRRESSRHHDIAARIRPQI